MLSAIFKMLAIEVIISEFATPILIFSRVMDSSSNTITPVEITVVAKARRDDSLFFLTIDFTMEHSL